MSFYNNVSKFNRTRERLAYGETDERRDRNDKRHKPQRKSTDWESSPLVPAKPKNS